MLLLLKTATSGKKKVRRYKRHICSPTNVKQMSYSGKTRAEKAKINGKTIFLQALLMFKKGEGNLMRFGCYSGTFYNCRSSLTQGIRLFPREVLSDFLRVTLLFLARLPGFLTRNGSYRKRKSPPSSYSISSSFKPRVPSILSFYSYD